ncbi:MAG: response regulator [Methylomarinum sp.]|nr:response regulator [Methylomarinum sp.]
MNHQNILIIDDDEICCLLMKERFELLGFTVAYLLNGRKSLQLIRETKPALVVLDIHLPEMDGFEIIRELGEDRPYIIAVSSSLTFINSIKRMGANEAYIKADFEEIIQAVSQYFSKQSA